MAGGYWHDPKGIDGVVSVLRSMQRQIDELRGSAGIKSAILRGDKVEFQDASGELLAQIGANVRIDEFLNTHTGLTTFNPANGQPVSHTGYNSEWDATGLYVFDASGDEIFQIHHIDAGDVDALFGASGTLDNFSVDAGSTIFLDTDGQVLLRGSTGGIYTDVGSSGSFWIDGALVTTTNPANLYRDATTGAVYRVTSGRKYKADIKPAVVSVEDARAFLSLGRTWVDRGALERDPQFRERTPGSIAEELHALTTMRQFVRYDDEGNPDGVYYDRLYVALLPLLKHLDTTATQQQAEIDDLKSTVASLTERLDALEAAK